MNKTNPLLLFRIGWMDDYAGRDEIQGGGSYVEEHRVGGEMWNFKEEDGQYLGYVRTHKGVGLNLEQIEPEPHTKWTTGDEMSGVDIVFIATRPKPDSGQVVVGWYKNATVFHKSHKKISGRGEFGEYVCKAATKDAVLVHKNSRTTLIKGNNPFHSNVWYGNANSPRLIEIKKKLIKLIGEPKPDRDRKWQKISAREIRAIEVAAVDKVTSHYRKLGYTVETVEQENKGWDLVANKENKTLLLEVKGHRHNRIQFELTPNEYEKMQQRAADYKVCVVINALSKPALMVFRPVKRGGDWHMVKENGDNQEIRLEEIISARAMPILKVGL